MCSVLICCALCSVMFCCGMLCDAMLRSVLSCSVMLCCVMLCSVAFVEGARRDTRGSSGTLGTTGGLAAAVCRVGVSGRSVLEI